MVEVHTAKQVSLHPASTVLAKICTTGACLLASAPQREVVHVGGSHMPGSLAEFQHPGGAWSTASQVSLVDLFFSPCPELVKSRVSNALITPTTCRDNNYSAFTPQLRWARVLADTHRGPVTGCLGLTQAVIEAHRLPHFARQGKR